MVMTREWGGDDRKLFPSSQSVNYSFPLIRLWSQLPPPWNPPSNHSISQSEILSELIPGNVYFEEQIVALLLTQCLNMEVGIGTDNPMYGISYSICQRVTRVCHVAFSYYYRKVGISKVSRSPPLGTMNMCTKFHGFPSNSCRYFSLDQCGEPTTRKTDIAIQ